MRKWTAYSFALMLSKRDVPLLGMALFHLESFCMHWSTFVGACLEKFQAHLSLSRITWYRHASTAIANVDWREVVELPTHTKSMCRNCLLEHKVVRCWIILGTEVEKQTWATAPVIGVGGPTHAFKRSRIRAASSATNWRERHGDGSTCVWNISTYAKAARLNNSSVRFRAGAALFHAF